MNVPEIPVPDVPGRVLRCATHHLACDCREWQHAQELRQEQDSIVDLVNKIEMLQTELRAERQARRVAQMLPHIDPPCTAEEMDAALGFTTYTEAEWRDALAGHIRDRATRLGGLA